MYKQIVPHAEIPQPPPTHKKVHRVIPILWRKKTNKKHKTWENDGEATIVHTQLHHVNLKINFDGMKFGLVKLGAVDFIKCDSIFSCGANEVQISEDIDLRESSTSVQTEKLTPPVPKTVPPPKTSNLQSDSDNEWLEPFVTPVTQKRPSSPPSKPAKRTAVAPFSGSKPSPVRTERAVSVGAFRTPLVDQSHKVSPPSPTSLDTPFTPSLIRPLLLRKLRPHQLEAIEFMYNCVLGLKNDGNGCILADEMGLGKTLSSIALIDTLLNQQKIQHCLIVCPATLVANWKSEIQKWLPFPHTPNILTGDSTSSVQDPISLFFSNSRTQIFTIMIMSYERVRLETLKTSNTSAKFDLVVCDEAHRLKSSKSKTQEALESICGEKRVLLTGTPIQNDLMEFFALANFANLDCLGKEHQFKKEYRQYTDRSSGSQLYAELTKKCSKFMLRRTSEILLKYVNVDRTENVVFLRPNDVQTALYEDITNTKLNEIVHTKYSQTEIFTVISQLRKAATGLSLSASSKLDFLKHFLNEVKANTDEKVVVVSGSTRVLDMVQNICASNSHAWLRLDGSTPTQKRQSSVKMFNTKPQSAAFVFLLSTRSGGAGLNLIGGSRLVLMDCDWNPAADIQAMARIHRDGQKNHCRIYRLLTTGTIDEKMFQRQMNKCNLSSGVLDRADHKTDQNDQASQDDQELYQTTDHADNTSPIFSLDQLRDLFSFTKPLKCDTLLQKSDSNNLNGFKELEINDCVLNKAIELSTQVSCVLTKMNK